MLKLGLGAHSVPTIIGSGDSGERVGDTPLLDAYSGAVAAYSVRKLRSGYSGSALRVRRDSDNTEQDIGFDSNGDLDTAAIATFCGSATGYVSVWYDQTTSINDASQNNPSLQPMIYDGTEVITEDGKAAVSYKARSNSSLVSPSFTAVTAPFSVVFVSAGMRESGSGDRHHWGTSTTYGSHYGDRIHGAYISNGGNEVRVLRVADQTLTFALFNGANSDNRRNTISETGDIGAGGGMDIVYLGVSPQGNMGVQGIVLQEWILWDGEFSSTNRTGIESSINKHYSIYPEVFEHTSGLLYDYPNAAAAYSVRQLGDGANFAMRVRRDSDNEETNIGFDSNGDLDTAAINTFCGTANGYVSVWYDQTTSMNDAAQSDVTKQPQIYNGTAVITENGKPCMSCVEPRHLTLNSGATQPYTQHIVCNPGTTGPLFGYGEPLMLRYDSGGITKYHDGTFRTPSPSFSSAVGHQNHSMLFYYGATTGYAVQNQSSHQEDASITFANLRGPTQSLGGKTISGNIAALQEFIIWDNDQYSNRTAIEDNINSEYLIYQPTTTPTSGLLADYSGAEAAYSVRRLSDKAVIAMRIRRDSDNAEINIGFDSNGDLDTTAISDFCSTANGYVVQWTDQSTNGNHAAQSTEANQPQIYNGTAVITENGKPAIDNDGFGGDHFVLSSGLGNVSTYTVFTVLEDGIRNTVSGEGSMLFAKNTSDWLWYQTASRINVNATGNSKNITTTWSTSQRLDYHALNSGTASFGTNSSTLDTVGSVSGGVPMDYILGHYGTGGQYNYNGKAQELIIYTSDQSSNRTAIETSINDYFSIY